VIAGFYFGLAVVLMLAFFIGAMWMSGILRFADDAPGEPAAAIEVRRVRAGPPPPPLLATSLAIKHQLDLVNRKAKRAALFAHQIGVAQPNPEAPNSVSFVRWAIDYADACEELAHRSRIA
jgi:hypothetical protein